jgi:hypothetical protein
LLARGSESDRKRKTPILSRDGHGAVVTTVTPRQNHERQRSSRRRPLLRRQRLQNLRGVTLGLDLRKHLRDLALFVDDKRAALDAHVLAAVHAFFFPDPVGLGDGVVGIRHKREGQLVLGCELSLRLRLIRRDADDLGVLLRKFLQGVAKLGRFLGSARCVCLGEEVEDHALPAELGELKLAGANVRRPIADLKSHMPRL